MWLEVVRGGYRWSAMVQSKGQRWSAMISDGQWWGRGNYRWLAMVQSKGHRWSAVGQRWLREWITCHYYLTSRHARILQHMTYYYYY